MDAPEYRHDDAINLASPRAAKTRKAGRFSKLTLTLASGICAVAIVLSGIVIAGFVAPDAIGTAAVPPDRAQVKLPEAPAKPSAGAEKAAQASPAAAEPTGAKTAQSKPEQTDARPAAASNKVAQSPPPKQAAPKSTGAGAGTSPPVTATAAAAPLTANDTRWGLTTPPKSAGETAPQLRAAAGIQGATQGTASTLTPPAAPPVPAVETAVGGTEGAIPDDVATAALPAPGGETAAVPVAETDAEIAKLEAETGMTDGVTPPAGAVEAPSGPLPKLSAARATKYVNLRASPADEGRVITVVPANAAIEAESGCEWCAVVYKGQRGYIYKSFIGRGAAEAAAEGIGLY